MLSMNLPAQLLPKVSSGTLQRHENFQSRYVSARNVDVWLPENYSSTKRYAVLYMQDGQMLFDSSLNWNHSTWDVEVAMTQLQKEAKIKEVIVVGISNNGNSRHADYFPQKPFESLTSKEKETIYASARSSGVPVFNEHKIHSDDYLKFMVTELKPFIDRTYPTFPDAKNTVIAGSSMGGLISMYAICEYPEVFGGAACMSTHWPGIFTLENNPIPNAFLKYLPSHLPDPKNHKIYFDYGDQTLDAMYPPLQREVDEIMKTKGFSNENWMTRYFPGEDHSENAWRKRLTIPVIFLLGNSEH